MTQSREDAKQRTAILKQLRDQHQETVERTRALLKEQQAIRRQICQQLRSGPKIVPEIAEATGLPAHEALWHITAMKKYDLVVEVGQCGEYYQYAMAKETES
jgi:predicted Rossmann fold nucleotide-binding protein DprA/Smf involved in DNA uptake